MFAINVDATKKADFEESTTLELAVIEPEIICPRGGSFVVFDPENETITLWQSNPTLPSGYNINPMSVSEAVAWCNGDDTPFDN